MTYLGNPNYWEFVIYIYIDIDITITILNNVIRNKLCTVNF